jgi:transcriptional regulator with XRE-family HTH domain
LRVFGGQVRRYRELRELSQSNLGDKISITGSHIGKIERGETRCDRKLAKSMDDVFGTDGALTSLWDELVQSAAFPTWFDWPEVEQNPDTVALEAYECLVVYGLLQTEEYARALLLRNEASVSARMGRQERVLGREDPPPPRITVLLTEFVLYNEIGEKEIMRRQLEHLLSVSSSRISVQIVPNPMPSAGTDGSFCVATLSDRSELAFVETPARGFTLSEAEDMHTLADKLADIRATALPVSQSKDLIYKIMEERWN